MNKKASKKVKINNPHKLISKHTMKQIFVLKISLHMNGNQLISIYKCKLMKSNHLVVSLFRCKPS